MNEAGETQDTKDIMVQTMMGQVYLHSDFVVENHIPFAGMVRITDNVTNTIYWFNIDNLVWIGPRR